MLYQDMLTGYFHEVPDDQFDYYGYCGYPEEYFAEYPDDYYSGYLDEYFDDYPEDYFTGYPGAYLGEYPYEIGNGPVIYDELGNPVGIMSLLRAGTRLLPGIIKGATSVARKILPTVTRGVKSLVRGGLPIPLSPQIPLAHRLMSQAAQGLIPKLSGQPFPSVRPPGWIPRPTPYQGLRPRRLYMRCLMWPGPRGLVPAKAAVAPQPVLTPIPTPVPRPVLPRRRGARRVRPRRRR